MHTSNNTDKLVYLRLLTYVKPYWKALALSISLLIILGATEPIFPALMKPLIDEGFTNKNENFIEWIPIILVVLFISRGLLSFSSSYASHWVSNKVVTDLRDEMFSRLLHLETIFFDNNSSGILASRITNEVGGVTGAATSALNVIMRDSITLIALTGWLIYLDWKLTIITLIITPVIWITVKYFNKRLRIISKKQHQSMADLSHIIEESASRNRVIKIFCSENFVYSKFRDANEKQRGLAMRGAVSSNAITPIVQMITSVSVAFIIAIALNQPAGNTSTAGGFMSFLTALLLLLPPTKRLTDVTATIQRGLASAERVFELIDANEERSNGSNFKKQVNGKIKIKNVRYKYPGRDNYAIDKISINIPAKESVALVGGSGSGKTTLTSLISGLYEINSGTIEVDDIPITQLSLQSLRQNISIVSQDVQLFNDTVLSNVTHGNHQPDKKKAIESLKHAYAWDFITEMKDGLNTIVGQNGVKLSGGQRQRLAIARAFYKDSPILILDEATSALDSESEQKIQYALNDLLRGRTTIIIAHRLATIKNVDRIIVMESGKIIEQGTHMQLINNNGPYSHYYNLQFNESP